MVRLVRPLRLALGMAALFGALSPLASGCFGAECLRMSDCVSGDVCALGQCLPMGSTGAALDGSADVTPSGPPDASLADHAAASISDARADTSAADAPSDAGPDAPEEQSDADPFHSGDADPFFF